MRVFFAMAYPGYLRYFDSTIQELNARGHEVELWFEGTDKQTEGLDALDRLGPATTVGGVLPGRTLGLAKRLAMDLRRTTDFLRYLDPRYRESEYLRDRAAVRVPAVLRGLTHIRSLPRSFVRAAQRILLAADAALPRATALDVMLRAGNPDVVVVTPLVMIGSRQADLVASARAQGIPVVLGVASWDHLTTKGLVRGNPSLVLVWNEAQLREAAELHFIPESRVRVTGAQPFDKWFDRDPRTTREEFCSRAGLDPGRPFVLFAGSTASISSPDAERMFVERWARAIRASPHGSLSELGILIRPHPYNSAHWADANLDHLDASVWPRHGANPIDERDRAGYFDSLYHSVAVVGINTSAMIEAAIVGRPVLTIELEEFNDTQDGTLHFHYLLPQNGGFLQTAPSIDDHLVQLAHTLANPDEMKGTLAAFVQRFVRPHGNDRTATAFVADAIEEAATLSRQASVPGALVRVLGSIVLVPFVAVSLIGRVSDRPGLARELRRGMKRRRLRVVARASGLERRSQKLAVKLRAGSSDFPTRQLAAGVEHAGRRTSALTAAATRRLERNVGRLATRIEGPDSKLARALESSSTREREETSNGAAGGV